MFEQFFIKLLHKIDRKLLWELNHKKYSKFGLEAFFILSFDCDTEEDIKIGLDVHKKLQDMGITPVYAVPGELLKKGEKVYKKIFESGSEFINHGGREHTYFNPVHNRHASCFFYDQQSQTELEEDIRLGHKTLQDVLGITAKGWRTPHFGTFQKPEHLRFLYGLLKEFDYRFSTSTSPSMGYINGPIYEVDGIAEIPVTGIFSEPLNIMDTWAYFAAPDRVKTPKNYLEHAHDLLEFTKQKPLLINIYGDPSHIYNKPEFFQSMKVIASNARNTNYSNLLEMIK